MTLGIKGNEIVDSVMQIPMFKQKKKLLDNDICKGKIQAIKLN